MLDSLARQSADDARTHIIPGFAGRLAAHHAPRSTLNLPGPRSLDLSWVFGWGFVKTGEEFRRHVGALVGRQGHGLAKNFLGSRGHEIHCRPT
jgi:hypothetical protein